MNKQRHRLFRSGLGLLILVIMFVGGTAAYAQQPNQWSPQARIPVYDDMVNEQPPHLISAPNGTVYAFNAQTLDTDRVIMYREWTQTNGWSDPNDIFVSAGGGTLEVLDVFLDRDDIVHLVMAMGGNLSYSKTSLANAYDASKWSTPLVLDTQLSTTLTAGIAGDDQGNVMVIFAGNSEGNGVYWLSSDDNGENWSDPTSLFLTLTNELWAMGIQVYAGDSGNLHAVWNTIGQDGQGDAVYYTNYNFNDKEWRDVFPLAERSNEGVLGLGTLTPAVVEYNGSIIASYYNGNVNGNWWRLSSDNGRTWTDPMQVSARHVGTNGAVSYTVDSRNVLHGFFGERINDQNHGMWHINWTGFGWTEAIPVVSGPQIRDVIGGNGFDPRSPRAVVSQGNEALVTWVTDGIAGQNGAWFSHTVLDAQKTVTRSLLVPIAEIASTSTPKPTPTLALSATSVAPAPTKAVMVTTSDDFEAVNNPSIPLIVGLAPIVLLISALIAYQLIVHHINR